MNRLIFWCVLVAFVLNILQPGYMQFYDVRKPLVGMLSGLKRQNTTSPRLLTTKGRIEPVSQSTTPQCQPPKNDYDRILFAQGIGGCSNAASN